MGSAEDAQIIRQALAIVAARARHSRAPIACLICGLEVVPGNSLRKYCSRRCVKRAYRARLRAVRARGHRPLAGMTRDERLILEMLAHGAQPWQVAVALRLSTGTTNRRICRLVVSLGARTRCHMVALAVAGGLVTLDDLAPPGRRT